MASLIIQDTFAPYYAGRDGKSDTTAKSTSQKSGDENSTTEKSRAPQRPESRAQAEIILPVAAPAPTVPVRREPRRGIVAH